MNVAFTLSRLTLRCGGVAGYLSEGSVLREAAVKNGSEECSRLEMDGYPVSCGQEALFQNHQRAPESGDLNAWYIAKLRRPVDIALTCAALDRIVERHPILRTVYSRQGGVVSQRVVPNVRCDCEIVDARPWSAGMLEDRLGQDGRKPFDLEHGPVFRARLYSQSDRQDVLLVCAHQIAADRQSLRILSDEFERIYAALAEGSPPDPEPALGSYFDYARQQRQMLESERGRVLLEFWRDRVSGDRPVLSLPRDRVRSELPSFPTCEVRFQLPRELSRQIEALAERQGHPVPWVCLAAYTILLSRYGGAERVSIGSSASDRDTAGWENVVGNFANRVAITADCAPQLTFTQLLGQVSAAAVEARAHQELPFAVLAGEAGIAQQEPFCEVYFAWEEGEGSGGRYGEVKTVRFCEGPCELGLRMFSADGQIQGMLLYSPELFEGDTIERMSRHWIELLRSIVASPDTAVGELELMPAEERKWVMGRSAGPSTEYPRQCLHELFAEQVAQCPEAEAVVYGSQRLTYRELDRRSNRIAQYLRSQGLGREDRVGIFMERSVDMIVSMLGIVKAGGAYVPLDPAYPVERLQFLVDDMEARWVLTHRQVQAELPTSAALVYVDDEESAIAGASEEPVANVSTPESIAVLIYTSGSTGRPKGACIPHRAAVRLVRNTNFVRVTREDRVAQVVSPSFDVCIFEVWSALVNGAALIGVPRETLLAPTHMAHLLRTERISVLFFTTAYLHQIGRDAPNLLRDVRAVLFGGEAAETGPIRNILKHGKPGSLTNVYGPAETGVVATYYEITSIPDDARTVPIGRPIANAQVYVLDSRMRPVPIGLPGEIYIGGEGVARGYWNRPELNAEKFLPDPFSRRPGALLYRTGDLARIRGNGDFEFIGRIDHQVKIRGHRIELPEVQLALAAHPDVKHAFVMVREDQSGNKRLVAYVTLRRDLPSAADALRHYVKSKLPPYMVPASFVVIDAIPLTTNGKVDRKALPPPHERPNITHVPPRTGLERVIAKIWEELLGIDHIGLNDDFFELGGHSLLAACLVARIEKHTGHNIPVATLFEAPTVGQLARKIDEGTYASAWSPLVELHRASGSARTEPLFCLHSLGANLISYKKLTSLLHVDRPIYGLQPHGLDGRQEPLDNIEEMAAAYLQEIRARQPAGPYHLSGICLGGVLAYEIAQQLLAAGEQVRFLLLIDAPMPGPLEYLHTRSTLTEYLDRHLGEMLLLRPAARLRYLATWLGNGGIRLASALGWQRGEGSVARATEHVVEANLKAFLTYRPKPYAGKVTLFICSDSSSRAYEDRRLAWGVPAEGGLELHIVPGNHLSMVEEPHVRVMAQTLQRCLDQLDSPDPTLKEISYATKTL